MRRIKVIPLLQSLNDNVTVRKNVPGHILGQDLPQEIDLPIQSIGDEDPDHHLQILTIQRGKSTILDHDPDHIHLKK